MVTLCLSLSAAIYVFMQRYMPTNRAVAWLRTPRGLKWAIPVALVATPFYLGLTALAIRGAIHPGLSWLNVLVFLLSWDAIKFAMAGLLAPFWWLRLELQRHATLGGSMRAGIRAGTRGDRLA